MVAVPVSFMMFLVKTGCCPSLDRKSPRTTSFRRRMRGSNWICNGAEATSAPPSRMTDTDTGLETRVSICAGEKMTRALPAGGVVSAAGATGGTPGVSAGATVIGGPVTLGGAPGGEVGVAGVVDNGAVAGGLIAGAVIGGAPAVTGGFSAGAVTGGAPTGGIVVATGG